MSPPAEGRQGAAGRASGPDGAAPAGSGTASAAAASGPAPGPRRGGRPPGGGDARLALIPALFLALTGCADTVKPVLGGLKLGVSGSSFHVPVMQNERPPFEYPRRAWEEGVGGETRVRIHITAQGRVDSAYVLESSGHPALDSAALAGARRLRYRPARMDDRPVSVWAVLPVRYPMPGRTEADDLEEP